MRFVYLIGLAALVTGGYFYFTQEPPPPPPPPPQIDLQKVKNRREIIRFYERAIADLERSIGYRAKVNISYPQGTNYDPYRNRVTSSGTSNHRAHLQQIEEYRRRIAVMKAEIGE